MIKEDYTFNNQLLYERRKVISFNLKEIETLCLYFKAGDSFFVSYFFDFLEIDESFDLDLFKQLLSQERIDKITIFQLIRLFGNYEGEIKSSSLDEIYEDINSKADVNLIYFSVR